MPLEIRAPEPDDLSAVFDVRAQAFAVPESDREPWMGRVNPETMLTAFADGLVVGSLNAIPMGQWFGGADALPMGGIATVVVRPEWRGRGVGAQLLAASLVAMHARGDAVSSLHPATTRVYRASGWELAGDFAACTVPTRSLERLGRGAPERLVRITRDDWSRVEQCYATAGPDHRGWLARPDFWWRLLESEAFEAQAFVYGVEGTGALDGALEGYVWFRQEQNGVWGYDIVVEELVALSREAAVTLWGFLGANAMQVERIRFPSALARDLAFTLPEQDALAGRSNRWMHRIVEIGAALTGRRFAPGVQAEVELDLTDPAAPWNAGRHRLRVEGGRAEVVRGGAGRAALGINGLSALAAGAVTARGLVRAGMLEVEGDAEIAALDAIFSAPFPEILDDF